MSLIVLLGLAGGGSMLASWLLTCRVRRFALARNMLDVPNARSSHSSPTPRGGVVAIVASVLLATSGTAAAGLLTPWTAAGLAGGCLIAAVGWLDDRGHVRASGRALVHVTAASWAVWCFGGMPLLDFGAGTLALGPAGAVLAVVGIVWATNFFNFMDGIDGIAGVEAVTAGIFGGVLLLLGGVHGLAAVVLAMAGASAGFLAWNWAPARVFMGDVGSGFLGFLFGSLAVASQNQGIPLPMWVLLLGVFWVDATATLLRRVARRQVWYDAHREHAYQRAVLAGWSHARVSATVLFVNGVLGLLALAAWRFPSALPWILLAALAMLVGLYGAVERMRAMA
jgi:Fuc2NAc and GlcNAc transferase